jgi:hypothetical protein
LYATTAVAMHWRVLPSPWIIPIPNLASEPRNASSSDGSWPVPKNATDSAPCLACIPRKRETNASSASGHATGFSSPFTRKSGVTARSSLASGASACQPLGQAFPRFTG